MIEDQVEKHHLLFYITTIIIIFLIEYFLPDLIFLKTRFIGFIFYFSHIYKSFTFCNMGSHAYVFLWNEI